MKKVLSSLAVLCMAFSLSFASNPFDEFANNISQKSLDSFALDLGPLLAGGSFHQGKSLGFPGFDIGIHVPAKSVNTDNVIVKQADLSTIFLPVVQLEIGLPMKFDIIGRYSTYADSTLVGGGIRYGILRSALPGMPSFSVQGLYNTLDVKAGVNQFKANTMTLSAMASFNLPVVDPYVGASYDATTVEPGASIVLPTPGMKGTASGYRFEAGINLALFPMTYLQLGGALVNGDIGYILGLGVKY